MKKYDVVYILKKDVPADELRYSLRSVVKNLPYRKIWFYCGKPDGIEPDEYVEHIQSGATKWERAKSSVIRICENDAITEKFWLFNDDFFILQPIKSEEPHHRGLLRDHIREVEKRHNNTQTLYTRHLRQCYELLREAGYSSLDYALHAPMLVDRALMLEALRTFPTCPMFRSLYGNYAQIGGRYQRDYKLLKTTDRPDRDAPYLSTSNKTFSGEVTRFIQETFPEPSKYETGRS